jgi:hypothetical protein
MMDRPRNRRGDAESSGFHRPELHRLSPLRETQPLAWLQQSLTTFAESVASFLPGHLEAYARIHHPFDAPGATAGRGALWRAWLFDATIPSHDPAAAVAFALSGIDGSQAEVGRLPRPLIGPLVEHLRQATATPDRCFFAVWEGHGDLTPVALRAPRLVLPQRSYHVFAGPIEAAHTSFSADGLSHLAANLWWPADQAWCVATEIDFAWTYVGGPRSVIEALLAEQRFEAVATTAAARW